MADTKKLRKASPTSIVQNPSLGTNGDIFEREFRRAKKLTEDKRNFEDSWQRLLGEPKSTSSASRSRKSERLVYEEGSWSLGDTASAEESPGIIWEGLIDSMVPPPPDKDPK